MRRGLALVREYAKLRHVFGAKLIDQPLYRVTLASLEAEFRAAFLLAFEVVQLLGRSEAGALSEQDQVLLRLLTPIAKLLTAKQSVAVLSEMVECFGGAGYVEDTGIPVLLRDAQVLPIWEGATNVLALDAVLRAGFEAGVAVLEQRIRRVRAALRVAELLPLMDTAEQWFAGGIGLLRRAGERDERQANARGCVINIGRALQLALLVEHAQWQWAHANDRSGAAAARCFSRNVVPWSGCNLDDAKALCAPSV